MGRALGLRFDTLPAVSRLILRGHLKKHPRRSRSASRPIELRRKKVDPTTRRSSRTSSLVLPSP